MIEEAFERPGYAQRLKEETLKLRKELSYLHYHRDHDPIHIKGSDRISAILQDLISFEFDLRALGEDF